MNQGVVSALTGEPVSKALLIRRQRAQKADQVLRMLESVNTQFNLYGADCAHGQMQYVARRMRLMFRHSSDQFDDWLTVDGRNCLIATHCHHPKDFFDLYWAICQRVAAVLEAVEAQ